MKRSHAYRGYESTYSAKFLILLIPSYNLKILNKQLNNKLIDLLSELRGFNLIQDRSFWRCSRMAGGAENPLFSKIYYTYATIMKLGTVMSYLKKIQKANNHVTQCFYSADISIFSPEISKFCYIKKYRYRMHFNT